MILFKKGCKVKDKNNRIYIIDNICKDDETTYYLLVRLDKFDSIVHREVTEQQLKTNFERV
jgi:hypothetical protein